MESANATISATVQEHEHHEEGNLEFLENSGPFSINIQKIMECIKTAIKNFPELKADFKEIIALFKANKYLEALIKLKSLQGPALEVLKTCKEVIKTSVSHTLESFGFPDIDKIINCIRVTCEKYPEVKSQFEEIFALAKKGKIFEVLIKLGSLTGTAKDIYNQCK